MNPLITAIIYAPYRLTLKKLLINIPIGNRLQYTYRDTTETRYSFNIHVLFNICWFCSFLSSRNRTPRNRVGSSTDQELSSIRASVPHNDEQRQSLNSAATTASSGSTPKDVLVSATASIGNGIATDGQAPQQTGTVSEPSTTATFGHKASVKFFMDDLERKNSSDSTRQT